jgi:beta-lactamase class A
MFFRLTIVGARIALSIVMVFSALADLRGQTGQNTSCITALTRGTVCNSASKHALEIMNRENLEAITVAHDVQTGSLVAFAASHPDKLNVTSLLLPLSTVKLMLAASWWDHAERDDAFSNRNEWMRVAKMIVSGSDDIGRGIASDLRKAIGTKAVLNDLERYGFPFLSSGAGTDTGFWAELAPEWKEKLVPSASYHSLSADTAERDWEDTLSIGEARFKVTALSLSRFLQAIGNNGLMLPARARAEASPPGDASEDAKKSVRVMQESTAVKLQKAMRAVVERGTAKGIAEALRSSGWQIGGKTGTGPGPQALGPHSDGWFAGLIFDPEGSPRFTVATFVRHGGLGGGKAAQVSAELARFLSSAPASGAAHTQTPAAERFAELEQRLGSRVSVAALDPQQNKRLEYRSGERFPMCSTFKLLAVAAVLKAVDEKKEQLDRFVPYTRAQLLDYAPVTRAHVTEGGMKLADLCAAAIEQSDNTAGNLLLATVGGPAGLNQFARLIGDTSTRLDHIEPELNNATPGEPGDSTTAAAMCTDLHGLLRSDFLSDSSRSHLENWMRHCETGAQMIRRAAPADWQVGDKTGRSTGGAANDIAIMRPRTGGPLFLSIFTFTPGKPAESRDEVVGQVTRICLEAVNN